MPRVNDYDGAVSRTLIKCHYSAIPVWKVLLVRSHQCSCVVADAVRGRVVRTVDRVNDNHHRGLRIVLCVLHGDLHSTVAFLYKCLSLKQRRRQQRTRAIVAFMRVCAKPHRYVCIRNFHHVSCEWNERHCTRANTHKTMRRARISHFLWAIRSCTSHERGVQSQKRSHGTSLR